MTTTNARTTKAQNGKDTTTRTKAKTRTQTTTKDNKTMEVKTMKTNANTTTEARNNNGTTTNAFYTDKNGTQTLNGINRHGATSYTHTATMPKPKAERITAPKDATTKYYDCEIISEQYGNFDLMHLNGDNNNTTTATAYTLIERTAKDYLYHLINNGDKSKQRYLDNDLDDLTQTGYITLYTHITDTTKARTNGTIDKTMVQTLSGKNGDTKKAEYKKILRRSFSEYVYPKNNYISVAKTDTLNATRKAVAIETEYMQAEQNERNANGEKTTSASIFDGGNNAEFFKGFYKFLKTEKNAPKTAEIFKDICNGLNNAEICKKHKITTATLKTHIQRIKALATVYTTK